MIWARASFESPSCWADVVATSSVQTSPFGSWKSPITPEALVSGAVGISEVIPEDGAVWWAESRPDEGGRTAIVRWANGETAEITPADANVRTRVHEYGGGAWWVDSAVLYYVDFADQRLRSIAPDGEPLLLSAEPASPGLLRYADMRRTVDANWLVAVGETHADDLAEPRNEIVAIATDGSLRTSVLVSGADFYGSPRISPDGSRLAWVQWDHPNMPWDDTELWVADLVTSPDSLSTSDARPVAGGPDEAIVQPEWSPDGRLHYLSDRTDLWQLYVQGVEQPVLSVAGEIGYPPWVFGLSRYGFDSAGEPVAAILAGGVETLPGFDEFTAFNTVRTSGNKVSFAASSWSSESTVIYDGKVVREPRDLGLDPAMMAAAEVLTFPTGPAAEAEVAYALYFAPANPKYQGLPDEKPPLIVLAHGGPTAAARSQLALTRVFWTSRGFAVVDVNYRGSSGFGRAYRKKLEGEWGIADVQDCVAVANYLVDRGDVDPERLIIRGGSAGGFTVLSALAFHGTFTAGANMYGVADLSALADDTHKFESRYLDGLVGPYPQQRAIYEARSPINHLDGFDAPMIVLQGSEDEVVPPDQSRSIVAALAERGVPVAYIEFEGEQHGFRKAESITVALASELAFYGKVFGFVPADDPIELEIRNLD